LSATPATITTTLRPHDRDQGRVKAIRVLCDWLAEHHPDVVRLDQLDRTPSHRTVPGLGPHPALAGSATGRGKTVGLTAFHHDVVDLRVFFEDIAEWGWPTAHDPATPVLRSATSLAYPTPCRER
jgi:hypothetical protein